ncbi:hypothetical protein ACFU78_27790 [Streptomyces tendae]|uniref:hypothetical protein n=1 Tax=Streptomyces tendae TaxID=1932 RepID=UPI00340F1465
MPVPVVLAPGRRPTRETGADTAAALGVRPERSRPVLRSAGAGSTAPPIASAGPVPFVSMAHRSRPAGSPVPPVREWTPPGGRVSWWTAVGMATQRLTGSALLPVGVVTGVADGARPDWLPRRERRGSRL